MAGLMMQPPGGAQPPGMAGPGMQPEPQPNVAPEEQAQYDQFVGNAVSMIYDKAVLPGIVERLKSGDNPAEGLANTTALVVMQLEDSAKEAGTQLSPDVLYQGGAEIMEHLAEVASAAKIHDFTEQEIEGALYAALDIYREARGGQLDENAVAEDWQALTAADAEGRLGDLVPGLPQPKPEPQMGLMPRGA